MKEEKKKREIGGWDSGGEKKKRTDEEGTFKIRKVANWRILKCAICPRMISYLHGGRPRPLILFEKAILAILMEFQAQQTGRRLELRY